MPNPLATQENRDTFLATPRLAILISLGDGPAPIGVPVWFEYNGSTVEMFADQSTPKSKRLENNSNASVLVTNAAGEPEAWLAFDDLIKIQSGGFKLAERLAARYWDLTNPDYKGV